jgi:hypothetical protein
MIHFFIDGAGAHYKNKLNFANLYQYSKEDGKVDFEEEASDAKVEDGPHAQMKIGGVKLPILQF